MLDCLKEPPPNLPLITEGGRGKEPPPNLPLITEGGIRKKIFFSPLYSGGAPPQRDKLEGRKAIIQYCIVTLLKIKIFSMCKMKKIKRLLLLVITLGIAGFVVGKKKGYIKKIKKGE
ncbi:hypothetical protein KJ885_03935 [Patescibacteria group bacterium]|nr:hypothetical protein [Patescibacteria group bacterium]